MADKKFRNKIKKKKKRVLTGVKESLREVVAGKEEYTEALGRRKSAIARVRLYAAKEDTKNNEFSINGRSLEEFFGTDELRNKVQEAFGEISDKYFTTVYVRGGGVTAQAEASRLGIARALVKIDDEHRAHLKAKGFLKRDPRSVERKKPGLKKARKAATWVKR